MPIESPSATSASTEANEMGLCHGVVDCDVHNAVPRVEALFPYLDDHWREYISNSAFKGPADTSYPEHAPTTARPGSRPPEGGPAGSSLFLLREQVLDPWNVATALLVCPYAVESLHNPDAAAALARAVNDWQIEEWIEKEPRLRASIVVPVQQPDLAAREIERVGGHPAFVQVCMPVRSEAPYGNRRYHPIYAAAAKHDLAVGLHYGGSPGNPPTGAGWPSYYVEEYAGMAQVFQTQLMSLIAEGVFARFPELRVVLIESGVTWLPSFMWRFDKEWKGLRREVPWVQRRPSEYIRAHVRLTTEPFDVPPTARELLQVIDQIGSDEILLYSSDYPHWHDTQAEADGRPALPAGLPDELKRKILGENARAFYRF